MKLVTTDMKRIYLTMLSLGFWFMESQWPRVFNFWKGVGLLTVMQTVLAIALFVFAQHTPFLSQPRALSRSEIYVIFCVFYGLNYLLAKKFAWERYLSEFNDYPKREKAMLMLSAVSIFLSIGVAFVVVGLLTRGSS